MMVGIRSSESIEEVGKDPLVEKSEESPFFGARFRRGGVVDGFLSVER
jgi:hypothetical protein